MHCTAGRILKPELLDYADPEPARRSLRELVTINRLLGGHHILRAALARMTGPNERFTLLDVGSASGDMARIVVKSFPGATVTSLDRRMLHLQDAPRPRLVADAFALPFAGRRFDFVHCSLFLHHFTDDEVARLLGAMYAVARRALVIQDLERHPLAYYFLPATRWLFRWSEIVLHDGPISVEAAFTAREMESLARRAGIRNPVVRVHRPAFRVSLVAAVS